MREFTHRLPHSGWTRPSRNEEEYFHTEQFRRRMAAARAAERRRCEDERKRLVEAHRNRCPSCGSRLEHIHVKEGDADQCPHCLGVWLSHEMFDRLTHPTQDNSYLTGILRDVFLQYTTGAVPPKLRRPEREER